MPFPITMQIKIVKLKKKKKFIYIFYTKTLKIYFKSNINFINYNSNLHALTYKSIHKRIFELNLFYKSNFKKILFFLICWKTFKIQYTGKGYKIKKYKNINALDFTFGACHFVKTFIPKYKLKFRRKKAIIIFYKKPYLIVKNLKKITTIKPINLYTQRGLKNLKTIIFRKPKNKAVYI